jgi:hypothetical protein
VHAPLQRPEVGPALAVESHDLAVEDGAMMAERAVISSRLRECRRRRPGSEWQIARTPSHLISKPQCSSSRGRGPVRAIMGTSLSGIGSLAAGSAGGSMRWIIQSLGSSLLSSGKSA